MIKILCILSLFLIQIESAIATNYYFSISGDDAKNTGTSKIAPFKTIAKLNKLSLKPGDTIFFKRNEVFAGQINLTNSGTKLNSIFFEAYGKGNKPIITGAIRIKNWTKHKNNIYVSDITENIDNISQIFVNGKLLTLARYPNKGFITIDSSMGRNGFVALSLNQANGYWDGLTVIARMERWIYEIREVSSFKNRTIQVGRPCDYNFKQGYGFFLTNKLNALDTPGEWFYDKVTKKIYLIAPNGNNPNDLIVNASVVDFGFNIVQQKYISINNIKIANQRLDGIYLNECKNITINNAVFSFIYRNGISDGFNRGENITVTNNQFLNINNTGIDLNHSTCIIKSNIIKNIALFPGLGGSGDGQYIGILSGPNSTISYNILDSIGYNGIHCQSGDTVCNNYIKNVCLTKDDGAGIYCYKSDHVVIKNNIIRNSYGNDAGTISESYAVAHGIYIDDSSSYCKINNNTVINADYGLFIHNAFKNSVDRNIFYNNRFAQIAIQNDKMVAENVNIVENSITRNILYSSSVDQLCIYLRTYKSSAKTIGTFDKNYYFNPYSEIIAKVITTPYYPAGTVSKTQLYDSLLWRELFISDIHSKVLSSNNRKINSIEIDSKELISNTSFDKNINGWYNWGASNYTISLDTSKKNIVKHSLKSTFSNSDINSNGYFASGDFSITSDRYYQVTFNAMGVKNANLEFDVTQNVHPYKNVITKGASFLIKDKLKSYSFIMKGKSSFANCRIQFSATVYDSTIWVNTISFREILIKANDIDSKVDYQIIVNPTDKIKQVVLDEKCKDIDGNLLGRNVIILPFTTLIYHKF